MSLIIKKFRTYAKTYELFMYIFKCVTVHINYNFKFGKMIRVSVNYQIFDTHTYEKICTYLVKIEFI